MPVRIIVTFTTLPGRADEFIQAWPDRIAEVRQEPGYIQYELFRSVERPDVVCLLEEWTSPETLEAHLELNQKRQPIGRDLSDGRAKIERFET